MKDRKARQIQTNRKLAVLALLVLASGCLAPESSHRNLAAPASIGAPALFSDDTGGLDGTVFDQDLLPIEGAVVTVASLGLVAATDANGSFGFSFLPPVQITLHAAKPGYEGAHANVFVTVGTLKQVNLVLTAVASDGPYSTLTIRSDMIKCGVSFVLMNAYCPTPTAIQGTCACGVNASIDTDHRAIVSETVWSGGNEFMFLGYVARPAGEKVYTLHTPILSPPARVQFVSGQPVGPVSVPDSDVAWRMTLAPYYAGREQPLFNSTVGPACWTAFRLATGVPRACTGLGLVQELKFTHYGTIFYRALPPDLDKFSALPDG